ncbi:MAG TPA: glutaredoxin family protein [Methanoregulaceae archaeon]|nr:glutaredoxin family protein [Methanoregulaceae archaeon]HQJ87875.1 glutaredoxin family protein [Methanoregulaceae archaeon]
MQFEHVHGTDRGVVRLYALSTCGWCAKTRQLLTDLGVAFDYVYVDLVGPGEQKEVIEAVEQVNPSLSFPTVVIGDRVIVGFREKEIREALA